MALSECFSVVAVDPWKTAAAKAPSPTPTKPVNDPWSPSSASSDLVSTSNTLHSPSSDLDEFDIITNRERPNASQAMNINTTNNNSSGNFILIF